MTSGREWRGNVRTGYVAFLDVLGFSALVSGDHDGARVDDYLKCLTEAIGANSNNDQVSYVAFSDSIVLTTNDGSEESLKALIRACSVLLFDMLDKGIALRGAITYGP